MSAYLLIISTKAPYHSSAAMDAFEAALAASNVGLEVKYLFQHDGVYQLLEQQQNEAIAHKSIFKKLSALPLFDIEDILVDQSSLDERGLLLSPSSVKWKSLQRHAIINVIQNAKQVLIF